MKEKNWKAQLRGAYRSSTIQVNALAVSLMAALPYLQELLPQLKPLVGPEAYLWMTQALAVANILLRMKTAMSLADKGQK